MRALAFSWLVVFTASSFASPLLAQNISGNLLETMKAGGKVILMRHAQTTPGVGDPENFNIADCATQRNLNDAGRAYSRLLGQRFASYGIKIDKVLSSVWCRCVDTAKLVAPSVAPEIAAEFNSFFQRDAGAGEVENARRAMGEWRGEGNLLIVTHDVNMRAYVGSSALQGGFKIIDPKDLRVLGTVNP